MVRRQFIYFIIVLFFLNHFSVFSGEYSYYQLLGMSKDTDYLAFGEYGINEDNRLFSKIFVINVSQNSYVSDGVLSLIYDVIPGVDQDGKGALLSNMLKNSNVFSQYNINPLNKGKLIYVLLENEHATNDLSFIDYDSNITYNMKLSQKNRIISNAFESASSIYLSVLPNGETGFSGIVGDPSYYRKGVKKYIIRSIYADSNNTSLVFIVERREQAKKNGDTNIHYMVETVKWR